MVDSNGSNWVPQWSLADRLRKIRRDSHLSQEDFAHALGIKPTTYAAWEIGRNQPERPVELAMAIQDAFDVPAAWTLGVMSDGRPSARGDLVAAMQPQRRRSTDRITCVA